jgi:hypothetical protein
MNDSDSESLALVAFSVALASSSLLESEELVNSEKNKRRWHVRPAWQVGIWPKILCLHFG